MATLAQQHLFNNRPQSTVARLTPKAGSRPYLVGMAVSRSPKELRCSLNLLPHETDDTRITGGTRSLTRRLLALNVEGSLSRRPVSGVSGMDAGLIAGTA